MERYEVKHGSGEQYDEGRWRDMSMTIDLESREHDRVETSDHDKC